MPETRAEAQRLRRERRDRKAEKRARRAGVDGAQLALPPGDGYPPAGYPPVGYPPVTGPHDGPPDWVAPPPAPPTLRVLWRRHGPVITPPFWLITAQVFALTLPHLATTHAARAFAILIAAGLVGVWELARTRRKNKDTRKRAGAAWWFGTPWVAAMAIWPLHGLWLWALEGLFIAAGGSMAVRHMHENRYIIPPPSPPPVEPEKEDHRLVTFRDVICGPGGRLEGGVIEDFAPVKGGFRVDVELTLTKETTTALISGSIRADIAKPYDVPADAVSVEYRPQKRSEARVRFTIITSTAMEDRPLRWNGISTYDVKTGLIEIGSYMDGKPAHWTLHRWRSGAGHGFIAGVTDSGKALALDTPVPTPAGWTTMGELQAGDVIYDEAGGTCRVIHAWPVRHDRPCYEVAFSDGSKITADAEHLWLVDTYWSRLSEARAAKREHGPHPQTAAGRKRSTEVRAWAADHNMALSPTGSILHSVWAAYRAAHPHRLYGHDQQHKRVRPQVLTTEAMTAAVRVRTDGRANYSVRVAAPLQGAKAYLPVPPYTLGIWLGDGRAADSSFNSADPEVAGEIEREDEPVWMVEPPTPTNRSAVYTVGNLRPRLRRIGVLGDKHIPVRYLRASEGQRRALLAGLLDTDGWCKPGGNVEFTNTNERLARDVLHLVSTLGYKATIYSKPARFNGKDCGIAWTVAFTPGDKVFRLPRKLARQVTKVSANAAFRYITAINPVSSVPVRCITVDSPNELYLVGEACIPTHNTGTAHHLICEIGLAKMCARCHKRGNPRECQCTDPDLQRIANFWLGDPQRQPFSVWRGRAPVTAWGPEACLELLRATVRYGRLRAAFLGGIEWWDTGPDGEPRKNTGKGWFDPEPGIPLHFTILDELPLLTGPDANPELAKEATALLAEIGMQFRKTGVAAVVLSPMPDLKYLNDRAIREMMTAFNTVMHRCDGLSANMLGIEGNPVLLPKDVPGIGYINGPDKRPSTKFRTSHIPEYAEDWDKGVDVRHLAEQIATTPIAMDAPYLQVMDEFGWTGGGIILDSDELVAKWEAEEQLAEAQQAGQQVDPIHNLAALMAAGAIKPNPDDPEGTAALMDAFRLEHGLPDPAADPDDMATVLTALTEAGAADIYGLMETTGLSALNVRRALDALESTGRAAKGPADQQYVVCG